MATNGIAVGISSLEYATLSADGTVGTFNSVGQLDREAANELTGGDAEYYKVYSELKNFPIEVKKVREGELMANFGLLSIAADDINIWKGGTVSAGTADTSPDEWAMNEEPEDIELALKITTDDGTVITLNRCAIDAKLNGNTKRAGHFKLLVKAEVLEPVADLPPVNIADNTNASA